MISWRERIKKIVEDFEDLKKVFEVAEGMGMRRALVDV